jgi:hypothetical protein
MGLVITEGPERHTVFGLKLFQPVKAGVDFNERCIYSTLRCLSITYSNCSVAESCSHVCQSGPLILHYRKKLPVRVLQFAPEGCSGSVG